MLLAWPVADVGRAVCAAAKGCAVCAAAEGCAVCAAAEDCAVCAAAEDCAVCAAAEGCAVCVEGAAAVDNKPHTLSVLGSRCGDALPPSDLRASGHVARCTAPVP